MNKAHLASSFVFFEQTSSNHGYLSHVTAGPVPSLIPLTALPLHKGRSKSQVFFTCITSQLIYCILCRKCPGVVYIGETGRRLGDRFREHRLDVMKVALPVPAHFAGMDHQLEDMQVAVIKAGLPEQDKRRRKEMSFIHNFGTLAPWGLNQKE